MARYKFVVEGNKVTCISKFAGRPVKGYAKCSPNDKFDYEIGKELARARCDAKVAKKRLKRSKEKMAMADKMVREMTSYYFDMVDYNTDSMNDYEDCLARLRIIESKL